jgi:hypothetical protein
MKRSIWMSLTGVLIFVLVGSIVSAKDRAPKGYLNFSFFINPLDIGYQHRLVDNLYGTANLDYQGSDSDLKLRTGGVYLIPRKIIIFRFYGGGGFQYSRNQGYQYPYLTVGTRFLFLFSEIIHPLENQAQPEYRLGFSVKF